jgi:hypothetical protein
MPDCDVPICAEHRSAILAMTCECWLNDSAFDRKERQVNRSGTCGAPAVGLIVRDCEGDHDDECDEIGCPGYELMPACRKCLNDPNNNDVDGRDQQ